MIEYMKKTVSPMGEGMCGASALTENPKVNQVIISLDNEIDGLKNHIIELTQKITGTELDEKCSDRLSTSIRTLSEFANADSYYKERFQEINQLLNNIDDILFY
jgi:conjugal transfer/entry exclusion protein